MGLIRYTLWRCLQAVPVILGIVTITFYLTNQIPGDPVQIMLGNSPSASQIEAVQARYGLDRPLYERYVNYLLGVVQLDLGYSIYYDQPVTTKILERLPVTAYLVFSAYVFALVTAVPLGVISARRRNKPVDHVSRIAALLGVSTPSFWIGLVLIIVFGYHLNVLPATGLFLPWEDPNNVRGATTQFGVVIESFKRLLMPMIALGTLQMASITRIERSSMVDSMQNEYVKLARAYGVSERSIVWRHGFKPAQLPVITLVGLGLSTALGGAVLIETVFEINGMGRLIIQAIYNRDYELVMGTTLMLGVLYVIGVIITDISYAYVDPRVTYGEK